VSERHENRDRDDYHTLRGGSSTSTLGVCGRQGVQKGRSPEKMFSITCSTRILSLRIEVSLTVFRTETLTLTLTLTFDLQSNENERMWS